MLIYWASLLYSLERNGPFLHESLHYPKITLIGQLGKFMDKGTCVMGVMQHTGEKVPALPKGVPTTPAVKTDYVVYIGAKQWKNVAATVSDPEDALIIEGFPQIDAKTGAISVFASNVTSKKLQAEKRQQG
jgi:molybdopterin-guanine dinucleotide biosynthesis protein